MDFRKKIDDLYMGLIVRDFADYKIKITKENLHDFAQEISNLMVVASTKEEPVLEVGRVFMYTGQIVLECHSLNEIEKERLFGELESLYRNVLRTIKECA